VLLLHRFFVGRFGRHMVTDHAARDRAEHGVMAGVMPGNTADGSTL
jgi:hypothetical protein